MKVLMAAGLVTGCLSVGGCGSEEAVAKTDGQGVYRKSIDKAKTTADRDSDRVREGDREIAETEKSSSD